MSTKNNQISDTADREIFISRVLNAPRELVWKVWTEPEHIMQWWGPEGFTTTVHEMDVNENGIWRFVMHGPNNMNFPHKIVYSAVVKPERLEYTQGSEDINNPTSFKTTVIFEEISGKTRLSMRLLFTTAKERDRVAKEYGAVEGQKQTIGRMEEHVSELQKGQELVLNQTFNAPRELVYKALTEAEALAQWWGPAGFEMCHSKLDFRVGGSFHYGMKAPNGMMMWGLFKYLEMVVPERLVYVNSFSDENGNVTPNSFLPNFPLEILNILTLSEHDGRTKLTLRGGPVNATAAEQKTFTDMQGGMEQGFAGTFDQLETYLENNTNN